MNPGIDLDSEPVWAMLEAWDAWQEWEHSGKVPPSGPWRRLVDAVDALRVVTHRETLGTAKRLRVLLDEVRAEQRIQGEQLAEMTFQVNS